MKYIIKEKQEKRFTFPAYAKDMAGRHVSRFRNDGFTLVEIIISMFLVLILFSLLILEFSTLSISRGQKYENIAYHVANKQMEDLRSTPFSSLPASGTISDALLDQIPSGSGNFSVNDYPDYDGLKEIVVTVTWSDVSSKSVILKTLAGDAGLNSP